MLFSIIIPVYNAQATLERCLESVLPQLQGDCEVLLVDDGSSDGSGRICDGYAEAYPGLVRVLHRENGGPLLARLTGLEAAAGDYLLFADSDDVWLPNLLARLRTVITETRAGLVLFHHDRQYPDGSVQAVPCPFDRATALPRLRETLVAGEQLNSLWQKCVRRDQLPDPAEIRSCGSLLLGEDKLLSLAILDRAETAACIPEALYRYSVFPGSLSRRRGWKQFRDICLVTAQTLKFAARWGVSSAAKRSRRRFLLCFGLGCLLPKGRNRHAD